MKNRLAKILVLVTAVIALVAMMALPAMATGETVSVTGVSGVTVGADSNGTATESGGTVTVTVKGSYIILYTLLKYFLINQFIHYYSSPL